MTDTLAITKEEREEAMLHGGDVSMATVRAYESRLQQLEAALRRCDEAIQAWWPPQTTVSPEGVAVIEAGRRAHETLLAGEAK